MENSCHGEGEKLCLLQTLHMHTHIHKQKRHRTTLLVLGDWNVNRNFIILITYAKKYKINKQIKIQRTKENWNDKKQGN